MSVHERGARFASLLSQLNSSEAREAEAAVDSLLPEGEGLESLDQLDLQEFLWYQLPTKWMAPTRDLHEVAWSLGDLLAAAGLERYAGLCRAQDTHQVIERWQVDGEAARKQLLTLMAESGVDPLDTDLLAWGSVMGIAEVSARTMVSRALEQAIDAGQFTPGARGWKRRAKQVVDAALTVPQVTSGGRSALQEVCRERAERWSAPPPSSRAELLGPVVPLLEEDPGVPDDAAAALCPLTWLLEQIGEHTTLTQAGYLPRKLMLAANDEFGWFDVPGSGVRSETDVIELHELHHLARRARLITKRRRTLSVSAAGRRALRDPALLWRAVVRNVFEGSGFEHDGAGLAAALLVVADGAALPTTSLHERVTEVLAAKWHNADGSELERWAGMRATRDFAVLGELFGWFELDGDWPLHNYTLTPRGRQASLLGLRLQAFAPRDRP